MEDRRSGVLAVLDDGFCVRVHVSPAGRRSLLAEVATRSLVDRRCGHGHLGTTQNVLLAEVAQNGGKFFTGHVEGHGATAHGSGQLATGGHSVASRATCQERGDRDLWPVRDTDGVSYRDPRRTVDPTTQMEVSSTGNYTVNYRPLPHRSSYQIVRSHPQLSPTTEFPRQTSKPDIVRGNFVVGEKSAEHPKQRSELSPKDCNYLRSSDEYGAFYNKTSPSVSPGRYMDEEAFISSLRRYPSSVPERTKSIDMLQAIAYLQQNVNNKNIQARTLRYLREKAREVETELQRLQAKLSSRAAYEEPTREAGPSRDSEPKYKETRSSLLREHGAVKRHRDKFEVKRSQSYEDYDYLKAPSREGSRGAAANKRMDVRYLTDITSELKRFLAADESVSKLCPKLSKRYIEHRRQYHKNNSDRTTWYEATDPFLAGASDDDDNATCVPPRSAKSSCPPKICCYCRKPIPCICKKKQPTREDFIVQKVNEWVREIPVYPNESCLEKGLRDDLIKKLKISLTKLPADSNFLESARKHIEEYAAKLPMWKPESKADQEALEKQVVKNLLDKLEGISTFLIDKEIIDAFDVVKFKLKDSNCALVNRNELIKDVMNQLRDIVKNRSDDAAYRDKLRSKVADILAELPIDAKPGRRRHTLEKLAGEITDRLMKIGSLSISKAGGSRAEGARENFDQNAENLLKSVPGFEGLSESEKNRIRQEIINKFQNIRRQSDAEEVKGVVKDVIADVLKATGASLEKQKRKKLAQRLTGQITTSANTGGEEKLLWSIAEQIPEFKSVDRPEMNKDILEFAHKIRQIKRSNGENIGPTVKEESSKFVEALVMKADRNISTGDIRRRKDKISDELTLHIEEYFKSPRISVDSGKVKIISKWLEGDEQFERVEKEARDKMATTLGRQLNELQKQGRDVQKLLPEEILKGLKQVTKDTGTEFSAVQKKEIIDELMHKITEVMVETADQENSIWTAIEGIPDLSHVDQGYHYRAVKNLAMKLQNLKLHGGTSEEIQKEVKAFLDELSKTSGIKVEDNIETALESTLTKTFKISREKKSERKKWKKGDMPSYSGKGKQEIKKEVHDEVKDVLNESNVTMDASTMRELESLLADQVMRGKTGAEAAEEISFFLQDLGNLTADEADSIARKLTRKAATRASTPKRAVGLNTSIDRSEIALSPITSDTLFVPRRGKASIKPKPSKKSMEQLEQVIKEWSAQNNTNISEDKVRKLAYDFVEWSRQFDEVAGYDTLDEEGSLRNHLKQWLIENTDLSKRGDFSYLVDSLLERLRSVPLPSTSRTKRDKLGPENAGELSDGVAKWFDKLPIDASTNPQDQAKLNALKQKLVSRLMLKIGTLNMNPATLNDDFLYESMLSDEIDQLLDEFRQSRELGNSIEELKRELISLVMAAKKNIKEELAGNTYKQQIKCTIKKILPCVCGTEEVDEQFERLRSNIAESFVYFTAACQQRDQAIAKCNADVDKYIAEFIRLCSDRPNGAELKRKLLNELQNIPKPSTAALKSLLEEIKVREELKSWISQLPLINLSPNLEVQVNKILSVLGIRLRELEKQNLSKPGPSYDKKLQSEITKWISKLPLQRDVNLQKLASKFAQSFRNRVRADVRGAPRCGLSVEDREHMSRIRGRSGDDTDWTMDRLCPSASGRPCLPVVAEGSCQTAADQTCKSFSKIAPSGSLRCCQNSTQTISGKVSHSTSCDATRLSKTNVDVQTCSEDQGTQDQSQCVRSSEGYRLGRAPMRFNVTTPCGSTHPYPPGPCSPTNYESCNPHHSCASYAPPCIQGIRPHMRPPSCLMKRTLRERPWSSVQIEEPMDCPEPPRHYESGTTVMDGAPRGNWSRSEPRQQGNWYDCMRPVELNRNTCSDQRGPMRCRKRADWRRRSILNSKGPRESCAEPGKNIKCNQLCTRNCPHPSFLYFRN